MTEHATSPGDELLTLTRRFCAEVQAGDESVMAAFVERRAVLAAAVVASAKPPDPATVQAILTCDRELVALLGRRQHEIVQQLAGLAVGRRTLRTYLDGSVTTPAYVERLG